jgi:tetratricopeptide (TPR) repeat protein
MDHGRLFLKMKSREEALIQFEEAFHIFESYFGKIAIPTANAAFQLAVILEEQRRLKEALEYSEIA